MRPLRLLAALALTVACGSTSSGGGGGGSTGPASDAGGMPASDAGYSTGPATDGGSAGSTGPDGGGSTGTGTGAGGSDGGTITGNGGGSDGGTVTANDCAGLAPASLGTMQTWSVIFDGINGRCGLPMSSGDGVMAQVVTDMAAHPNWDFIDTQNNTETTAYKAWSGDLFSQPAGPAAPDYGYVDEGAMHFHLGAVDDRSGRSAAVTPSMLLYANEHWDVGDPSGGLIFAGAIRDPAGRPDRRRIMSARGTFVLHDLDRDAPIFGLGVDLNFHTLVIQAGDCAGCVTAQWIAGDGNAMTAPFTLLTGFVPGGQTWFETAPLIGGGLAVRRMDANDTGDPYPYKSTWLLTIAAGSTSPQPAPGWMTARPDTNLVLVRNRTAYAVLPNGATDSACTQRLEIVSPGGTSCAQYDLALPAATCTTSELRVGYDGTVLQHTPTDLERNPYGRPQSCTLRYWPGALR